MRTNRSDFTTWVDDAIRAEFERHGHSTSETWLDLFLGSVEQQLTALCVADEQAVLTRAQVLAAARHLAGYMLGRGIDAGDVVTVAVRMGTAEEIAAAVEFLLTPSASLVSGADLLVTAERSPPWRWLSHPVLEPDPFLESRVGLPTFNSNSKGRLK